MMKNFGKLSVSFLLSSVLISCATITQDTDQQIYLHTNIDGKIDCVLENEHGSWEAKSLPSTLKVDKSRKDMSVVCNNENQEIVADSSFDSSFDPWVFGNVVFGGLIGVGIDAYSGAMFKYPKKVRISANNVTKQ